jgi:hypothetical protein
MSQQRRRPNSGGNPLQSVVDQLLEANSRLTDRIIEMSRVVADLQKEPDPYPVMQESRVPLHTPESVEDAEFLFHTGQITRAELEDALSEIGFYNDEIVVPG